MSFFTTLMKAFHLVKTVAVAPDPLPPAWLGIDRREIPRKNTVPNDPSPAAIAWFRALTDRSNLRFCGAYLTGNDYPANAHGTDFTSSANDIIRNWVPNVWTMRRDLGWGIVLWYMGYSATDKYRMPTGLADPAARGTLHALHAKMIVSKIPPASDSETTSTIAPTLDGAVVMLDNEDKDALYTLEYQETDKPSPSRIDDLKKYYKAFFEELQKEEPGLPALRIGVYAHPNTARLLFLPDHPSLFVWLVKYPPRKSVRREYSPFDDDTADPLKIDLAADNSATTSYEDTELQAQNVVTSQAQWLAWPLGRQFRNPTTRWLPPDGSPLRTTAPIISKEKDWDFNCALVRDPLYPVAEPRIAFVPNGTLVAGKFSPRHSSGTPKPRMDIKVVDSAAPFSLTLPAAQYVEPDAPIVQATFLGAPDSHFASILRNGNIAVFSSANGIWNPTTSSATMLPRRLHALSFVPFEAPGARDLWLFYIGSDRALYGMGRSMPSGPWSAPAVLNASLSIHAFSAVAAASRAATSVDLFVISKAKLLTTISWTAASNGWSAAPQQIETGLGMFLPTTALAAVSAAPNALHVFGVGADLKLRYVEYTGGSGWGPVKALGAATDFVSPHTRIAVHAVSATRVEVAAISDTGKVRVHALVASGSTWAEDPSIELLPPQSGKPLPDATGLINAIGWRINPFGDLALGVVAGETVVFAAGVSRGAKKNEPAVATTAVLRGSIKTGGWQRYG